LRVEDPCGPGGQLEPLHAGGILVQQVPKVRRGSVGCLDLRYLWALVQTTLGDASPTVFIAAIFVALRMRPL
jgi:hypothetical protein